MVRRLGAVLFLAVVVGASSAVRVRTAFRDPNFDAVHPDGMLKSDPALLYYFTERILDAGGLPPDDFRADPRVQFPELTDVPAEFTVGQEFLVAWAYRLFGSGVPLHAFCVEVMAVLASLTVVGAWLLTLARTRSFAWASLAACFFAVLPANYRTIGFILVREDLAFPLFALHLGLLAFAARRRTPTAFLGAGVALAAALATWHAMSFFVALEVALLAAAFLATGRNALAIRGAWGVLVAPVVAGLLVPALSASGFLLGLPMILAWGLAAAALLERLTEAGRLPRTALAAAVWAGLLAAARLAAPGRSAYAHVYEVLWAKLVHLGVKPADPHALSFDARLLWQGPFDTLPPGQLAAYLGWGVLALLLALAVAVRRRRALEPFDGFLVGLTLASLPLAWLFGRTFILAGFLVPVLSAVVLAHLDRRRLALGALGALVLLQGSSFVRYVDELRLVWYLPPGRQEEIAELVRWVRDQVPASEPIAADFMNSTAILAQDGNPIVLQPKYETERSRRRAQRFLETFFFGTPADLAALVRDDFRCRYLLVDRYTEGYLSRYTAGAVGEDPPGSAAALFLSQDEEVLRGVPGFELVYRSPSSIRQINGEPYDLYRLYRLTD